MYTVRYNWLNTVNFEWSDCSIFFELIYYEQNRAISFISDTRISRFPLKPKKNTSYLFLKYL